LSFLHDGAWTKRFQVGWTATNGLTAATLARAGFKGAAEPLEGRHGFMQGYAPQPTPERAVQDLGQQFELMNTAVKPYPSCRYGHAAIDAALALRAALGLRPDEIEHVTVGLPQAGLMLVGEPADKKADPRNVVDGQFSGPFVVAAALCTGAMGWDSYGQLQDPAIRALLPRIRCAFDPAMEAEFPANMSATVAVRARGAEHVRTVVVPKGEPSNFLSETELRAKFAGLADAVLGPERAGALADALLAIDRAADVAPLFRLATPLMHARMAGE
jgi:2-methylcitrate dehydratase PrpD